MGSTRQRYARFARRKRTRLWRLRRARAIQAYKRRKVFSATHGLAEGG